MFLTRNHGSSPDKSTLIGQQENITNSTGFHHYRRGGLDYSRGRWIGKVHNFRKRKRRNTYERKKNLPGFDRRDHVNGSNCYRGRSARARHQTIYVIPDIGGGPFTGKRMMVLPVYTPNSRIR